MSNKPPRFTPGWKVALLAALPVFAAAMWYGIANRYEDIWLYAFAMALLSCGIGGWAVTTVQKWQEWRTKSRSCPKS